MKKISWEFSMQAEDLQPVRRKSCRTLEEAGNYSNRLVPAYVFIIISADRYIAGRAVMHGVSRWQEDIPSQERG